MSSRTAAVEKGSRSFADAPNGVRTVSPAPFAALAAMEEREAAESELAETDAVPQQPPDED